MTRKVVRLDLINSIKRDLMGPNDIEETLNRVPIQQYLTGIIYPEIIDRDGPLDEQDDRNDVGDADEEIHTRTPLPRSIGLSLIVKPNELKDEGIEIRISGAIYCEVAKNQWRRYSISGEHDSLVIENKKSDIRFTNKKISKSMELKDISPLPKEYLEGFEIIWETLPLIEEKTSKVSDKWYLSIFLLNKRKAKSNQRALNCMYQIYISVQTIKSWAIVARDKSLQRIDEDLKSLSLLYNNEHEFAVGHQVSVNWNPNNISDINIKHMESIKNTVDNTFSLLPKDNLKGDFFEKCQMVETTFFPEAHRKDLDWEIEDLKLNMNQLSDENLFENGESRKSENINILKKLSDKYHEWIENTFSEQNKTRFSYDLDTFNRHHEDCKKSLSRIKEGIDLIEKPANVDIYKAFCLMNRAMWLNIINQEQSKKKKWPYVIDLNDKQNANWRPFQMAFILQILPSISNNEHDHRNFLDLLWVPTGGGKTEAYLGIVAFLLFLSRIKKEAKEDDGVEVLMRYTLRLLTIQQFQRATRMIMACEYIRKIDRYELLDNCKPFSIGLYVGQNTTPNKITTGKKIKGYNDDYNIYEKIYKVDKETNREYEYCGQTAEYALMYWEKDKDHRLPEGTNPVQILYCPWCGEELTFHDYKLDREKEKMEVHCGNKKCPFNKDDMPLRFHTVDQSIIENPPSLLIGTVDKFAQLTFNTNVGRIFGWSNGKQIGRPISLIIQDELHLINGPLGSMVGLYEASIDFLSSIELKGIGLEHGSMENLNLKDMEVVWRSRPKIIASTATIRNAERQCLNLYDRKAKRFPSPGTDISNSFFVRERKDNENDKSYVGVFCSGIGMKTTIKRCVSSVLIKTEDHKKLGTELQFYDPYWTIVSYFNSKRELGSAVTLMRDDVRTNVETYRPTINSENAIGELHGGLDSTELPNVLLRLNRKATDTNPNPYDILLCTNMFSVGIDIDRLGLMTMDCQPKATTEYLQSTGRVGRKGDGLIIVLFNQARPRDQSHFERFYDYHTRIQYHVEAMTVTPFSEGSIGRALHAQYVTMMRHTFSSNSLDSIYDNTSCINYSNEHRNHESSLIACLFLIQRANRAEKSENVWMSVLAELLDFQEEWIRRRNAALESPSVLIKGALQSKLLYTEKIRWHYNWPRLLEQDPSSPWFDIERRQKFNFSLPPILTPNSLRDVEEEIALKELWRK